MRLAMKKQLSTTVLATSIALLSGCTSLSGYDSENEFGCSAPAGVSCKSIRGVYANKKDGNLPSQQARHDETYSGEYKSSTSDYTTRTVATDDEFGIPTGKETTQEKNSHIERKIYLKEVTGQAPKSGDPIYAAPKVVRIWFSPFSDKDGTLHDQSFSYVVVQTGGWDVEHIKDSIKQKGRSYIKTLGN